MTFEEEDQTTLTDVLQTVRHALLPDSDLNLFAKRPEYAAKSDRLAVAMKQGDADAFSEFVEFHMPLARQASRMLVRWFEMDVEDAEQTAMIGLIEAARRFDPDRGYQFSTYAGYWIRQCCQRYGLEWGLQIRVPPHIFWRCYRLAFERTRLIATYGERDAQAEFETFRNSEGVSAKQWSSFWTACHVDFLAELEKEQTDRLDVTYDSSVLEDAASDEFCDGLQECLKFLPERQAEILRLRYGIGEREHTLQEVADHLGITRERVRQIQVKAEEKLERRVAAMGFGERAEPATADSESIEIEESPQ